MPKINVALTKDCRKAPPKSFSPKYRIPKEMTDISIGKLSTFSTMLNIGMIKEGV